MKTQQKTFDHSSAREAAALAEADGRQEPFTQTLLDGVGLEQGTTSMTVATQTPPANGQLTAQAANPMALLQQMIEGGYKPDDLGAMMDLCERYEKNRAAEVYGQAITAFQRKCPAIHKGRKVDAGPLRYQYASFDDVMAQAGPVLAECGIAVAFSTEANEHGIRVTVRLRVGIHSEEYTLDVPVPEMKVNNTQRYGAALSYAKRYALCAALNIVVTDEDDDANGCLDPVSEDQLNDLDLMMSEVVQRFGESERGRFLKFIGAARLADIPAKDFNKAKSAMRGKLNAGR